MIDGNRISPLLQLAMRRSLGSCEPQQNDMAAVAATCEVQFNPMLLMRLCITEDDVHMPRTSELTCEMNLYLRCDLPDESCAEAAASCFFSCICCTCKSAQQMPLRSVGVDTGMQHTACTAGEVPVNTSCPFTISSTRKLLPPRLWKPNMQHITRAAGCTSDCGSRGLPHP